MSLIHAQVTEKGVRFRLWSTGSDSYISKEMLGPDLRARLLKEAMEEAEREIDERINRATSTGTSDMTGLSTRDIHGPWDTSREQ